MPNPKMIADPDDATKQIPNPDYDPTKNEDGTPIVTPPNDDDETDPVKKAVNKAKADFKAKQDALDKRAREAEQKVAEFERKEREAETARLKADGKLQEAHDRELADRDAKIADLEAVNTKNTRDVAIRDALTDYTFRTPKARNNAVRDIVDDLKQNEAGEWESKSGKSLEDYVADFMSDEDNIASYLKAKQSTGGGTTTTKTAIPGEKTTSIFALSQDEVLKRAREGKL